MRNAVLNFSGTGYRQKSNFKIDSQIDLQYKGCGIYNFTASFLSA